MKVRTLRDFNDLQSKKLRKVGEVFEVTEKRARELTLAHNGTLIEVVEEEKKEVVEEEKKEVVEEEKKEVVEETVTKPKATKKK